MMGTDNQASSPAEHEHAPATIGVKLQQLREQKGLELQQVSEETRISVSNLVAIEGDMYNQLPADTFVRGLVTIYGNFLGVDGSETARLFLKERDLQQPKEKRYKLAKAGHSLTPKKLAEPSNISSATIAAILLVAIVVSFSAVCLYTGWNPFAYFLSQDQSSSPPGLSSEIENIQTGTTASPQIITPAPAPTRQLQKNSINNDSSGTGTPIASSPDQQPAGGN